MFLLFILNSSLVLADNWWNRDWNNRILLNLTETIGINRTDYVIIENITFPKETLNCWKEIRIIDCINQNSSSCNQAKEIPSNILSGDNSSWCEIEFPVNLSANSWKKIYIYYGNKNAEIPDYGDYKLKYFSFFEQKKYYGNNTVAAAFWIVNDKNMHMILTDSRKDNEETTMWKFNVENNSWEKVPVNYSKRSGGMNAIVCLPNNTKCYACGEHTIAGPESKFIWTGEKWKYLGTLNVDGVFTGSKYSNNYSKTNNTFAIFGAGWGKIIHIENDNWYIKKSGFNWHSLDIVILNKDLAYAVGSPAGITKWNGSEWSKINTNLTLRTIHCWSKNNCWAFGNNGFVVKLNKSGLHIHSKIFNERINDFFMTGPNRGFIIGDNGAILRFFNNNFFDTCRVTSEDLGRKRWRCGGPGIFMKNDSYGWIGGTNGTILHRGSVSVKIISEEVHSDLDVNLDVNKENYLKDRDVVLYADVSSDNIKIAGLEKKNFNVKVNTSKGEKIFNGENISLEDWNTGKYKIILKSFYQEVKELGVFNVSVEVSIGEENKITGKNKTSFYFLKIP
ncbi:MAG: hypothetical protein J7L08_01275, partial [Candidatus Aenigmarchaeota archaeon]|nr:hypothetical protein [Candidatus Aenigmarchaeota archaeon]